MPDLTPATCLCGGQPALLADGQGAHTICRCGGRTPRFLDRGAPVITREQALDAWATMIRVLRGGQ